MKKTIIFLSILFIVLILFSVLFWFYEVRNFTSRAYVGQQSFSQENSYVFVSPLRAKADEKEKIRTTVFLLNNQGLGVGSTAILFTTNPKLNVDIVQGVTDSYGKAVFDISSSIPGDFYLEFSVNKKPLLQKAHLSFY
ncbi:MAG: hypothetical protein ABH812_01485 [bacterium]